MSLDFDADPAQVERAVTVPSVGKLGLLDPVAEGLGHDHELGEEPIGIVVGEAPLSAAECGWRPESALACLDSLNLFDVDAGGVHSVEPLLMRCWPYGGQRRSAKSSRTAAVEL